ncbi:major facilitator superfamily domain-containing protein [Lasiosphaeris hirsuta]|uniref:Major facilitator superfamily domain-containing protein n=1 Tax=Lasiosphaeris hirsuta TaxID=260670 RepID=A0AA40DI47_9PEZI|nr:major facilitator superfamily domain-containing protein [Lasiosphaeris hirsuta]
MKRKHNAPLDIESEDFHPVDPTAYPEGGLRSWLVAGGTAGILFCTLGYSNSFGVFQAYYTQNQLRDYAADDISWIGAIQVFLVFALGIIGGPVFDRYGAWVIKPAAVIYLVSVMLTASCTTYWQFILVQGILSGVSNSLLMFPSMAATPQYFHKRRGAAMGLAIAGSSLGAIVFPIVLSQLLERVGFAWAVRTCGFIMIPILAFSAMTVKARLPPRKSRLFIWTAFKSSRYAFLTGAVFCMFMGMFVPLFYLPSYGISQGMDATVAFYLIALINASSIPGRILPGVLGDKFGSINSLITAGLLTAIIIFCWPTATTTSGIIVYSLGFGITSGAIISAGSVVFTHCASDPKDIGTYMGMGISLAAFAVLVGPPINGALLHRYDGYKEVSVFSGTMCASGVVLAFLAKHNAEEGIWGRV